MNMKGRMNTTTPSERSEKEGLAPEPRELSSEELVELSSEELERIIGGVAQLRLRSIDLPGVGTASAFVFVEI